ncbi:unnamed protein product [Onchocerca flexuosa]|uniref:EHD_N domain-containing protein n=1 Tax=Onchocerca flexuosa TaxID=387005 RepID=A0A183HI94_9BILA|nr:unnamed protein product [Onchocerca flexuosa]
MLSSALARHIRPRKMFSWLGGDSSKKKQQQDEEEGKQRVKEQRNRSRVVRPFSDYRIQPFSSPLQVEIFTFEGVLETVSDGLRKIYKQKLLPLEEYYKFHDFHSPALGKCVYCCFLILP